MVTHFRGGGQEIRVIPFTVNNYPDVLVLGVDEGARWRGRWSSACTWASRSSPWKPPLQPLWYAVAAVVVLGGIWSYFALSPAAERIAEEVAPPAQEAQAHGGGQEAAAPAGVDPALMEKGKAIYEANCAACHQANGQGMPPPSPPWRATPTSRTPR